MALRNNAYNNLRQDAYGNSTVGIIPKNAMNPSNELNKKNVPPAVNFDPNNNYKTAQNAVKDLKPLEAPEFQKTPFDSIGAMEKVSSSLGSNIGSKLNIGQGGRKEGRLLRRENRLEAKAGNDGAGGSGGGMSTGAGAGIAAGSAIVGAVGANMAANKQEDTGGILSGAAAGAGMGMSFGPVGAGIGAVIGGTAGYFMGKSAKEDREKSEKKEKAARDAYNAQIAEQKRITLGRAREQDKYAQVVNASNRYDAQGNLRYKTGGIIQYGVITKKELDKYFNEFSKEFIEPEKKIKINPNLSNRNIIENKPMLFRRGGKLDVKKTNVIVDGPSHEEFNNTGVKGDKGLPIVKGKTKIAEIESDELLLNKDTSQEVEKLVAKYEKTKDIKVKEKLGKLLDKELSNNTYDYSYNL